MILAAIFAIHLYWHLPILIVLISLVYSATRHDEWPAIWHEAYRWGRNMLGFLLGVGGVLFLLQMYI